MFLIHIAAEAGMNDVVVFNWQTSRISSFATFDPDEF